MKNPIIFLAVIHFHGVMNLYAPPGDPGGGPGGGDPPVGAPIDGRAVVLLIAGAAYGARKLKARKQSQKQETEE
jgi:hypothetical protein